MVYGGGRGVSKRTEAEVGVDTVWPWPSGGRGDVGGVRNGVAAAEDLLGCNQGFMTLMWPP